MLKAHDEYTQEESVTEGNAKRGNKLRQETKMDYCLGERLELYSVSSLFFYCELLFFLTYAIISFVDCITY